MPRNFRLIRLENFNARTDAQLVIAKELDEAQSGAISQGFEKCFQVGPHLLLITNSRLRAFERDISHKGTSFEPSSQRELNPPLCLRL